MKCIEPKTEYAKYENIPNTNIYSSVRSHTLCSFVNCLIGFVCTVAARDDDDGALCKLSGVICKSHNSHMGGFIETYTAVY